MNIFNYEEFVKECENSTREYSIGGESKRIEMQEQKIGMIFINGDLIVDRIEIENRYCGDRLIITTWHKLDKDIKTLKKYEGMEYETYYWDRDEGYKGGIPSVPETVAKMKSEKYTIEYVDSLLEDNKQKDEEIESLKQQVISLSEEKNAMAEKFLSVKKFITEKCGRIPFLGQKILMELKNELAEIEFEKGDNEITSREE